MSNYYGFLHWLIERNDYIYGYIFMQICKGNYANLPGLFNLCSLYECCISYIVWQPTLQDILTIAQRTCTFCLLICFTLTPGLFPSWINENNLFLFIHISMSFWGKICLRKIKFKKNECFCKLYLLLFSICKLYDVI